MLDLIEEKVIIDNCANYLEKALKDAKNPAGLFLQKTSQQGWDEKLKKLDPVGSTVRYEMMKLCTGSV